MKLNKICSLVFYVLCLCRTFSTQSHEECRNYENLTKNQFKVCLEAPDVTKAAMKGMAIALKECQYQFQWHRWNCTLSNKHLLQSGYRESSFAYSILSAGVAHAVTRACSEGIITSCGCGSIDLPKYNILTPNNTLNDVKRTNKRMTNKYRWKWGGCSHNIIFGIEFSRIFLDIKETGGDIKSIINLHNNHAGRMILGKQMQLKCKCHGLSGSCTLKTCWWKPSDFRLVGKSLKEQYNRAIFVDQSNRGSKFILNKPKKLKIQSISYTNDLLFNWENRKKLKMSLFYYQKSPNYCVKNTKLGVIGTTGRLCERKSKGSEGCRSLCCMRGYTLVKRRNVFKCNCIFKWCCNVECDTCETETWISVCK